MGTNLVENFLGKKKMTYFEVPYNGEGGTPQVVYGIIRIMEKH